jgi:D-alanyl-D-alanine dipeptidase/carboxypeptidase
MKTIQLTDKDIHKGQLLLVNRRHALRPGYYETMKTMLPIDENADIYLTPSAGAMLSQLIKACNADKEIVPISGFRSREEQQQIFDHSMRENGEEFMQKYVAFPDCSEHQTGLAIDVARQKEEIDFLCPDFPYSGICRRFRAKAAEYGFIERYQRGKESITGIAHEPWHFRYVGHPHAKIMEENRLSLEEYIAELRRHRYGNNPLLFREGGRIIEVSFLELTERPEAWIRVPDGLYQISGNNVDGVVITVWRQPA